MNLNRIFTICLTSALFFTAVPPLYAEISLAMRNTLERDLSDGKDAGYLRAVLRRVNQLARKNDIKRQERKVLFKINAEQWEVYAGKETVIVLIPGTHKQWKSSFELRRKLFAFIFYSRFNLKTVSAAAIRPLPVWMCSAIDEALAGKENGEQYHSGNKDFHALRSIVKHTGKLPDFTALPAFTAIPEHSAQRIVFCQMSRLLMETAAEKKLLTAIIRDNHAGKAPDSFVTNFASPREAQLQLSDLAMKLLFSRRAPLPPAMMRSKLAELEKITLPELDKSSVPTGKMLTLTFAQANTLLCKAERPDRDEIRRYYAQQCRQFAMHGSFAVSKLASPLIRIAAMIGDDESLSAEFTAALNGIKKQLALEEKIEYSFMRQYFTILPAQYLYRHHFAAYTPEMMQNLTPEVWRYLENTEKDYLQNY